MKRSQSGSWSEDDGSVRPSASHKLFDSAEFLRRQGATEVYRSAVLQPSYRSVDVHEPQHTVDPRPSDFRRGDTDWSASQLTALQAPPKGKLMGSLPSGMNVPPGKGQLMAQLGPGMDAPPGASEISERESTKKISGASSVADQQHMPMENPMDASADKDNKLPKLKAPYAHRSSVISNANPKHILEAIGRFLNAQTDCEFTIKKRNYKCSGKFFHQDRLCVFMIHMFLTPEDHIHPNATVVEFQRRSGDVFSFQRIYRTAVAYLAAQKLIHFNGDPSSADRSILPMPLQELPMPPLLDDEDEASDDVCGPECGYLDFSQDESLCKNLVTMCRSRFLEPRREATAVLARGSRSSKNAHILANVPMITPTLVGLLQDVNDMQVTRNCALVLTNLIECATEIRETGLRRQMVRAMCTTYRKWSGCDDPKQGSRLVSCQIGTALNILQVKSAGTKSFIQDRQSTQHLRRIAKTSPIREAAALAKQVLERLGAR